MIPDAEQKVVLELISDGRELDYINGLVDTVSMLIYIFGLGFTVLEAWYLSPFRITPAGKPCLPTN
jgi:hypothetical protein